MPVYLRTEDHICKPVLKVQDSNCQWILQDFFCEILSLHSTPKNCIGGLMAFLIPYVFMKKFF